MAYQTAARGAVSALRLPKADTQYVFFNLSDTFVRVEQLFFSHSLTNKNTK